VFAAYLAILLIKEGHSSDAKQVALYTLPQMVKQVMMQKVALFDA
jgi:hypothetical protein